MGNQSRFTESAESGYAMPNETAFLQATQLRFLEWVLHHIAEDPALSGLDGVVDALKDQADAIRREANTLYKGDR